MAKNVAQLIHRAPDLTALGYFDLFFEYLQHVLGPRKVGIGPHHLGEYGDVEFTADHRGGLYGLAHHIREPVDPGRQNRGDAGRKLDTLVTQVQQAILLLVQQLILAEVLQDLLQVEGVTIGGLQ